VEKQQLYDLVELPDDNWREQGEALHLPPHVRRYLLRFGMYRVLYGMRDGIIGLMMLKGPPGTGKSVMVRWAADTLSRALDTTGNALVINAAGLMDEHLGRSQKNAAELFDTIAFSAGKKLTVVILDDAESVFMSRRQSTQSQDPTDVVKVTTTILQGLDRLRFNPNVVQYATLNIEGLVDEAILSRCDMTLSFELPNLADRTAILSRTVQGLAGERVLEELAGATEGKSGRHLNTINLHAYLEGTATRREDLTEADYLRAVGLTPTLELAKDEPCLNLLPNRSQDTSLPMPRLLSPPRSSNPQPTYSNFQNGTNWSRELT
jgi:SpoVK/Ycf46/Vps4 family AAA+-type ATPase